MKLKKGLCAMVALMMLLSCFTGLSLGEGQTGGQAGIISTQAEGLLANAPTETKPTVAPPDEAEAEKPAEQGDDSAQKPTDAPTDEPKQEPTKKPTDEPTEKPTQAPAEEPTEKPTEEPTVKPTQAPTQAPTEKPTEKPTEEPTPTPSPTPEPHDESLCKHITDPNCEHLKLCKKKNCKHISKDRFGLEVPLCAFGEWYFQETDDPALGALGGPIANAARSKSIPIIDLSLGSATIWRSGVYTLMNSQDKAKGSLTIKAGRAVCLQLDQVITSGRITLEKKAALGIQAAGQSKLGAIAADKCLVQYTGAGSLELGSFEGKLRVYGGSLKLSGHTAQNDVAMYAFKDADGTSGCTVDGAEYTYTCPARNGTAYLWLPEPAKGNTYRHSVSGKTLVVTSQPEAPVEKDVYDISGGDKSDFTLDSYTLTGTGSGSSPTLSVTKPHIGFTLSGLGAKNPAKLVLDADAKLYFTTNENLKSVAGTGMTTVTGSGSLTVDSWSAPAQFIGEIAVVIGKVVGAPFDGLSGYTAKLKLNKNVRATLDGVALPLVYTMSGDQATIYLPTLSGANTYAFTLEKSKLAVTTVKPAQTLIDLSDGKDHTITSNGEYIVSGQPDAVSKGNILIDGGLDDVRLVVKNMRLSSGKSLTVGEGSKVVLSTQTANVIGGSLKLKKGSSLTLSGEGALRVGAVTVSSGGASISIGLNLTGVDVIANTQKGKLLATVIRVTDGKNAPVANGLISLKIGDRGVKQYTTDDKGLVAVWGAKRITGEDVVVMGMEGVSAAILSDEPAPITPAELPELSDITVKNNCVLFKAEGADTMAIIYTVGKAYVELPDNIDQNTQIAYMVGGECVIPGLKKGDVVSYRCVAAWDKGAKLTHQTQDGFAFSACAMFEADKPATKTELKLKSEQLKMEYSSSPFVFDVKAVPSRLNTRYHYDGEWRKTGPTQIGSYTCRIIVEPGDQRYLAGTYEFTIRITKIKILILPEESGKFVGEADPATFSYTWDGRLMQGDRITGTLSREAGESEGNYPFVITGLVAPKYYELALAVDAPMFFILAKPIHWIDPMDRIDPVHQVVTLSNGRSLDLILNTTNKLQIGVDEYGVLIYDTLDGLSRPFSPSLRLMAGYDSVLLSLQAEPELNKDHGFVTDADGKVVYRSRTLYLTLEQLQKLEKQYVHHVLLRLGDAAVLIDLKELRSEGMIEYLHDQGTMLSQGRFAVTLDPTPAQNSLTQEEQGALLAARLGLPLNRVSIAFVTRDKQTIDVTAMLKNASLIYASEALGEATQEEAGQTVLTEQNGQVVSSDDSIAPTVNEYQAMYERAVARLAQDGDAIARYALEAVTLDSRLIVPYTASERETLYPAMMQQKPYLLCQLSQSGLYGLTARAWLNIHQ